MYLKRDPEIDAIVAVIHEKLADSVATEFLLLVISRCGAFNDSLVTFCRHDLETRAEVGD